MSRILLLVALFPLWGFNQTGGPLGKPLFTLAVDYTDMPSIPGCYPDPPETLYYRCYDAKLLYQEGLRRAKAENKPLMIVWGFDECPGCRYFESTELNPSDPWMTGKFAQWTLSEAQKAALGNEGLDLEILLLRLHVREAHGEALAAELGVLDIAKARGGHRVWSPFITMTDPHTEKLVSQASIQPGRQPCNRWDEYAMNLEALERLPQNTEFDRRIC